MEKNSPLFLSVYGMLRKEAIVILANLSQLMAKKPKEPLSSGCGWVNIWIVIVVAMSYYHIICGDFIPSPLRDQ